MNRKDNFIEIPFESQNLDRYTVRTSILRAIAEIKPKLKGKLLDAGCGKMPYRDFLLSNSFLTEYVGLDIANAKIYDRSIKPDFTWDGKVMPFQNESFHSVMATEVLEHCPEPEVFLTEVFRVLKADGVFFFTVPFLWNLHEVPHDEYRYTPYSLKRHLNNCGFENIDLKAMGGWHASMAQMLGLWVRRSPLGTSKKKVLSIMLKPLIQYLLKLDSRSSRTFKEGLMITGIEGIAVKRK